MVLRRFAPLGFLCATIAVVGWGWRDQSTRDHVPPGPEAEDASDSDPTAGGAVTRERSTLVVDYRDDVPADVLATDRFAERPVSRETAVDKVYRIHFDSPAEATRARAELAQSPWVESVDFDEIWTLGDPGARPDDDGALREAPTTTSAPGLAQICEKSEGQEAAHSGFPRDPCFSYQWHMRQIGLPQAWKQGHGEGAIVAVIDTGVTKVADLAETAFVPGYNFVADNEDARDDHGHGTHVAGTIAQSTNNGRGVAGVAWGASIMPLKVLSARGSGSMAAIAQAIRFAADHGANVINMSLGGPFPVGAIGNAVRYAREKGVVVIAAAGNDGHGRVSYPARYAGVVAVAATDLAEAPTFYSNWGKQIDVAAPGGDTRADKNGDGQPDGVLQNTVVPGATHRQDYLWFMGTSMATPHVAGVAALIVGAGIRDPNAVESVLLATARAPQSQEAAGKRLDDHLGHGIVDAGAALRKANTGRGASELGLGAALAVAGVALARRRGKTTEKLGGGFALAVLLGAGGMFLLPGLVASLIPGASGSGAAAAILGHDPIAALDRSLPFLAGSPFLWSALLPVGAIALLQGVRRLRAPLAGFAFGVAGALAFAALAHPVDLHWLPGRTLETLWLCGHAALATVTGALTLRRA
jgi:serine protease